MISKFSLSELILITVLPAAAMAQYGSITPDPFDQLESNVTQGALQDDQADLSDEDMTRALYLSLAPNINEFGRFADGGSDSNWYVGFNNAWIVKLPAAPPGNYLRAFIGAKIGRAKTKPNAARPWERSVIPGKIYMAVSQRPAFNAEQSFFLAETKDIPLEPHKSIYMPRAGASDWFWTEVQPNMISTTRSNYLIIWSPTRKFREATQSPILAALQQTSGSKGGVIRAWNNHSIEGVPPRREGGTLQVPINLKPALAIKLVPAKARGSVRVSGITSHALQDKIVVRFSATGTDIDLSWVEMSHDELEWARVSEYRRSPPRIFSIPRGKIPARGAYLRGKARDTLANEAASDHIYVVGEAIR